MKFSFSWVPFYDFSLRKRMANYIKKQHSMYYPLYALHICQIFCFYLTITFLLQMPKEIYYLICNNNFTSLNGFKNIFIFFTEHIEVFFFWGLNYISRKLQQIIAIKNKDKNWLLKYIKNNPISQKDAKILHQIINKRLTHVDLLNDYIFKRNMYDVYPRLMKDETKEYYDIINIKMEICEIKKDISLTNKKKEIKIL